MRPWEDGAGLSHKSESSFESGRRNRRNSPRGSEEHGASVNDPPKWMMIPRLMVWSAATPFAWSGLTVNARLRQI
ncbi:hypothetical protein AVEN_140906-1 [Araneus ventricosus]|uniref:Uncharacterized protein n=1 Tax=Araneus ventricosus TaxID=182803 RepID=A0A4Y2JQ65_ARAVE|nr:hypothetical protein AVEN_140906-1 [Araneus ventricosus]